MRTLIRKDVDGASGDVYFEQIAGLSTETKPTANLASGSEFFEVDTGKKFIFDETENSWNEAPSVADLKSAITPLTPEATAEDVGKALIVKTVESGKATEYEYGEAGEGLSNEVKQALLNCFAHVAWIGDSGTTYYDALYDALNGGGTKTLESISAVYTPGIVYTSDSLDYLKGSLVVTATYSDTSTETVDGEDYTLSGTLTVGTSTVTVAYEGKTTTFSVTVYGFSPNVCKTIPGGSGSDAKVSDNNSRCLNIGTVGDHDMINSSGVSTGLYPVPIRSGVTKINADLGDEILTTLQILKWNGSKWVKTFGGEWNHSAKYYSLTSYNDGTYCVALVAGKDLGNHTLVDNTFNFTNYVFAKYEISFE